MTTGSNHEFVSQLEYYSTWYVKVDPSPTLVETVAHVQDM